ncbi:hypothetical protein FRC03_008495 [Tulasnella sp. 419]|nr:hypothetical protein FRC03_008495 [Tulasnella sp. 419]
MASLMPSMDRANEAFIEAFGNPVAALRNFDLVRYFAVMAVTLVLYDRVLTFPVELKRIWSGHVSKTKILYVIHQELTLAALMFNTVVMTTQHSSDENRILV